MINLKKYLKKYILLFFLFIVLAISIIYIKNNFFHDEVINENTGYKLQVKKDNTDLSNCTIEINNVDDEFSCYVIFTNNTSKNNRFSLSIYLNYIQIPFKVNKSDYSITYNFDLASNDSIKIPISFINNNILYKNNSLIFNVVTGIDKNACNIGEPTNLFALSAEYNLKLINSNLYIEDSMTSSSDYTPINTKTNFYGIIMNEDFNNITEFYKPNNLLHVKSGQDVNLAIRFGGYSNINNYLFFLVLNNEQIALNKSLSYLLFKNLDSNLNFTSVTFKAPEKKGKYELWAQMVKNPLQFQDNPLTSRRRSLDYSHRITLIVEW